MNDVGKQANHSVQIKTVKCPDDPRRTHQLRTLTHVGILVKQKKDISYGIYLTTNIDSDHKDVIAISACVAGGLGGYFGGLSVVARKE